MDGAPRRWRLLPLALGIFPEAYFPGPLMQETRKIAYAVTSDPTLSPVTMRLVLSRIAGVSVSGSPQAKS